MPNAVYFVTWRVHRRQPALSRAERTKVQEALRFYEGELYRLHAHVVMDDHVHALVQPLPPHPLEAILQRWKSYTAHVLAKQGRKVPIWQPESFDRLIYSDQEFNEKRAYIAANPFKRWPAIDSYPWVHPHHE